MTTTQIIRFIAAAHTVEMVADDAIGPTSRTLVSDVALPRDAARALVVALRSAGVEADDATDQDDRTHAWVYATPRTADPYRTTYHRDGSVTVWCVYSQQWLRARRLSDEMLASLSTAERERVARHIARAL